MGPLLRASSPAVSEALTTLCLRSVWQFTSDFHQTPPRGHTLLPRRYSSAPLSLWFGFPPSGSQRTFTSCSVPMLGALARTVLAKRAQRCSASADERCGTRSVRHVSTIRARRLPLTPLHLRASSDLISSPRPHSASPASIVRPDFLSGPHPLHLRASSDLISSRTLTLLHLRASLGRAFDGDRYVTA
jgi:hypothetical protein